MTLMDEYYAKHGEVTPRKHRKRSFWGEVAGILAFLGLFHALG